MRRTLNRLAALVCLAGGAFLAATPAPATGQASYPKCRDVIGTYCSNPGARSYCMIAGWQEPMYCSSGHAWSVY